GWNSSRRPGCFILRWCRSKCFFFQAADGIRGFHVTGVQTCALPIYAIPAVVEHGVRDNSGYRVPDDARTLAEIAKDAGLATGARSEERRGGKEWRTGLLTSR